LDKSSFFTFSKYISSNPKLKVADLVFFDNFHLIVFLILSPRAREDTAYRLSKQILNNYPIIELLAKADFNIIKEIIRPIGFYNVKAKRLVSFCTMIKSTIKLNSINTYESLMEIPGVGEKAAKKFLTLTSDVQFFLFDSHVIRVFSRLGFSNELIKSIESMKAKDLHVKNITDFSNQISNFGKHVCTSKNPQCFNCELLRICQFGFIER